MQNAFIGGLITAAFLLSGWALFGQQKEPASLVNSHVPSASPISPAPTDHPATIRTTDTAISTTHLPIGVFYDGKEGYSLSIPGGNESVCAWTYEGGTGQIPYLETTKARTATEKHTIHSEGYYNWKVTCVDDFGDIYLGDLPNDPDSN